MAIQGKNGAAALAVAVLVAAAAAVTGSAQQIPACASKLVPCAPYLNSTSPPDSCCGPLKQAAKEDMECLCALFKDKKLLETFKIDVEQGLKLAKSCGVSADQTACSKVGTSTAAAPSSSNNSTGDP